VTAKLYQFPGPASGRIGAPGTISLANVEKLSTDESMSALLIALAALNRRLDAAIAFAEACPRRVLSKQERARKRIARNKERIVRNMHLNNPA
jgi:hypothetical protein